MLLVERNFEAKNFVDKSGKTPLDHAKDRKHKHIFEYDQKVTITLYNNSIKQSSLKPDDFEYVMPLGKGAFGEVYLVQFKSQTEYFAMKIMRKRKFNGLVQLVLTEKEVSRKVRHRFIVKLICAFQTWDKLYLVSEFCAGGDLRSVVSRTKGLKESDARLYLAEILLAIEELHRNGIIHRDIKLDNVLLDSDGHVKVTDFGLAKEGMFEQKLTSTMLGGGRSY